MPNYEVTESGRALLQAYDQANQAVCENVGVQSVQNYPEPPSDPHNARDPWTQMCNQEKFENLLQRMYKLEYQMKEQFDTIYRQQRALAEHQHKQDGGVVVPYR